MNEEEQLELTLQAKGLDAPRLTPTLIDSAIVDEDYHVFPKTQMTVCCLTLRNGYVVTGEAACVSPENFDAVIGRECSRKNAREKIWGLEAYLLKEQLSTT